MTKSDNQDLSNEISHAERVRSARTTDELLRAAGQQYSEWFEKHDDAMFDRLEREGESGDGLFESMFVEMRRSRIFSLPDLLPVRMPLATVLAHGGTGSVDSCFITLADAFGLTDEEVALDLPWCGPKIQLIRTHIEGSNRPVYSIVTESSESVSQDSRASLRIALSGDAGEVSTARLNAKRHAAILSGDPLPSDCSLIQVSLSIDKSEGA